VAVQDRVVLAAQPASVSAARRFVRRLVEDAAPVDDALLDDAILVTSEVVANAVLHAGGPIGLEVEVDPGPPARVRVAVSDESPVAPTIREYGAGASTGRGLALVARLARRWGVDPNEPTGKVVWAELVDDGDDSSEESTPAASSIETPARAEPPEGVTPTRFLRVPVDVYLRLQEQNDAVLRELELLAFTADHAGDVDPSPELVEVIERSRQHFGLTREGFRREVLAALERGERELDLTGLWDAAAVVPSFDFVALFERAEELAADGELLIRPADAEVHALRRWFVEEMSRQLLDGLPPEPFGAQPPEDPAR
jgi:anti-sigma regulatory factor (Ser/Thr protein kinase)